MKEPHVYMYLQVAWHARRSEAGRPIGRSRMIGDPSTTPHGRRLNLVTFNDVTCSSVIFCYDSCCIHPDRSEVGVYNGHKIELLGD